MMSNPVIGITGATGFIGSALRNCLTKKGFTVIAFARNISSIEDKTARRLDLTENIPDDLFRDIDVLIHCAFVTREQHAEAEHINYAGSKSLFESCRRQGVKKIIFFSSVTADENARSAYAKSKFAIHKLLNLKTDLIVQCSLVIGAGGLFLRMLKYATTHTFIPVIGTGRQVIQLVVIDDVEDFIYNAIVADLTGSLVLASNERMTYKQMFTTIADVYEKKIYFISVPVFLLKTILKICKRLGIRMPVSEENILGLQSIRVHERIASMPSAKTLKEKLRELKG